MITRPPGVMVLVGYEGANIGIFRSPDIYSRFKQGVNLIGGDQHRDSLRSLPKFTTPSLPSNSPIHSARLG